MSVIGSNVLAGASGGAGAAGYAIERSLRFNEEDTAYLSKNFGSAGNLKTWTWSGWLKITKMDSFKAIFNSGVSGTSADRCILRLNGDGKLAFISTSGTYCQETLSVTTDAVFRDPSAWYHVMVVLDTTQTSSSADRLKIYVNGVNQSWTGTGPTLNKNQSINAPIDHEISNFVYTTLYPTGFYLADVHFIDGQALAPTDFVELDDNGVYQPKEFAGTYGPLVDQSQTWSSTPIFVDNGYGANGTRVITNAFNGVFTTSSAGMALPALGGTWKLDFGSNFSNTTTVEIQYYGGAGSSGVLKLNGVDKTSNLNLNATSQIIVFNVSSLDSIEWSYPVANQYCYIGQVKVDGKLLVDSGVTVTDNSFHLDFADNSSNAALGTDTSGNSNTWTVNNLSVAAGAGNDSLLDTPTNGDTASDTGAGGEITGNYATLNPLKIFGGASMSNGNLDGTTSTANQGLYGTIAMSSGKWYWEITNNSAGGMHGIADLAYANNNWYSGTGGYFYYYADGNSYQSGNIAASYGDSYTTNDVIGVAYDADNGNLYFYKNGTIQNSGTAAFTGLSGIFAPFFMDGSGGAHTFTVNFGQRAFAHTAPSGYKSLNTANLSSTIADGSKYFDVDTYTGTGNTHERSNFSFSPDFVWFKERGGTKGHNVYDIIRGATKELFPNGTGAENTLTNGLTSFDSDGFTLGAGTRANGLNQTYVAWAWDAGDSTVSNTDGSITSTVRANPSAGFSIVSYTGSSSAATVGHGLNAAPKMIIVKDRDNAYNWQVAHSDIGADESLLLNATNAATDFNAWNNTRPTSSVFSLGAGTVGVNTNGADLIAYCFAPVEGYSAIGTYQGNGNADGPFVYTGFRPAFIIGKRTDGGSDNWFMNDSSRLGYNDENLRLYPNLSNGEGASSDVNMDILSNGFKLISTNTNSNGSGATYIYYAVAEHPFASNGGLAR